MSAPVIRKPLKGLRIVSCCCAACSPHIFRASCFAARIASDLGADIYFTGRSPEEFDPHLRAFLTAGLLTRFIEPTGSGDADAIIGCQHSEANGSRVLVRIGMLPEGADLLPSSAFTLMAASGMLDIVGDPARQPLKLAGYQLDYAAGLSAYTAMAAMLAGKDSGTAHVSLLNVGIWLNWKSLVVAHQSGAAPSRKGREAEWQVLRCADGWIALVYLVNDWSAVKRLIDNPLLDDPDFDIRANRRKRASFIADIAEQALGTMTRAQIMDFAKASRVPIGAVLSPSEVQESPQYRERNFFHPVSSADGEFTVPRVPVLWGGHAFPPGPADIRVET